MKRALSCLVLLFAGVSGLAAEAVQEVTPTNHRGVYAVNGRLHVALFGTPDGEPITSGPGDMKPSWSKTGDKIVFFRLTKSAPQVSDWKTAICVVHVDGTGFRKLTDGTQTDFNPTWSRDGKNRVYFSRRDPATGRYAVYATTAEADPGEEVVVSDRTCSTFALSCLQDGRIFVSRYDHSSEDHYYLLTPGADGQAEYEPIRFTFSVEGILDRVSITPSETKVCAEFQKGFGPYRYPGRTLYIADFDGATRTVSNPQAITDENPDPKITWLYPRWTNDESAVVYHCDKSGTPQLYMFRLADGATLRVSTNPKARYLFPCGEATPK